MQMEAKQVSTSSTSYQQAVLAAQALVAENRDHSPVAKHVALGAALAELNAVEQRKLINEFNLSETTAFRSARFFRYRVEIAAAGATTLRDAERACQVARAIERNDRGDEAKGLDPAAPVASVSPVGRPPKNTVGAAGSNSLLNLLSAVAEVVVQENLRVDEVTSLLRNQIALIRKDNAKAA